MYGRGDVVAMSLDVRYEPSRDRGSGRWYRDLGDVIFGGLAQSIGEGEVDIISKSDQPLFDGGAAAQGRRRWCKIVPFV